MYKSNMYVYMYVTALKSAVCEIVRVGGVWSTGSSAGYTV